MLEEIKALQTPLEKKLIEQGFIDSTGTILNGPFKNAYTITELNRKGPYGETVLVVMENYSVSDDYYHFEISLTDEEVHSVMHTKNLMQLIINQQALRNACNPVFMEIRDKATKTEKAVLIEEDKKTDGKLSRNSLRGISRTGFANSYMNTTSADIPQEAYEAMSRMPKSFWDDPMVMASFKDYFFGSLDRLSKQFDTPEGIVVFRAYGNEVGNNCIGIIAKAQKTACDDKLLGAMLDFDTNMHRKENIAEGLRPFGGTGK